MESVRYLILGAGVTGLAFAKWIESSDYLILERDAEIGGYCKTVRRNGFTWDYSGHFFHFNDRDIEAMLVSRMPRDEVRRVKKDAKIFWKGEWIEFPFQKNIHQLPRDEFIECLYDLYFRQDMYPNNFKEMLYAKYGMAISNKFLIPYNEKLYATDLMKLDVDAMGRFFPHAKVDEIIRNFRVPDNSSYNDYFTYPQGGAIEYVRALASDLDHNKIRTNKAVVKLDLESRMAYTDTEAINYECLISSMPLPKLLQCAGMSDFDDKFASNKVLVFNLGFDKPTDCSMHWAYFPQRDISFYRVGFYNNIFDATRMSLYVEIGLSADQSCTADDVARLLEKVMSDLRKVGVVKEQSLIDWHHVIMDPAYVHITKDGAVAATEARKLLQTYNVHSLGRYGGWTYCSIEDNIKESRAAARALASRSLSCPEAEG